MNGFSQILLGSERFHQIAITTLSKWGGPDQLSARPDRSGQFRPADAKFGGGVRLEGLQAEHGELVTDVVDPGCVLAWQEITLGDEEGCESGPPGAIPRSLSDRGFGSVNCLDRGIEVDPRAREAKANRTATVNRFRSEHPSKLRKEGIESGVHNRGVRFTPEGLGQLVAGYGPVPIDDQIGEEQPTLATGYPTVQTLPVVLDDEGPTDLYAHLARGRQGHSNILAIRCR